MSSLDAFKMRGTGDDFFSHSLEMANGKTMSMSHFRGKVVVFASECWCMYSAVAVFRAFQREAEAGKLVVVYADHYHHCRSLKRFHYSYKKFARERSTMHSHMQWHESWPLYLSEPVTPAATIWSNPLWKFLGFPNHSRQDCNPSFSSVVDAKGNLALAWHTPFGDRRYKILLKLLRGQNSNEANNLNSI